MASHPSFYLSVVSFVLLVFPFFLRFAFAEDAALWQSTKYERGRMGKYPLVTYKSTDIASPLVNIKRWDPQCESDDYIFLSVHGKDLEAVPPRFFILDQKGMLIWCGKVTDGPNHLHVQRYRGEDHLVYWMGSEAHGVGFGSYYMLNHNYTLVQHIEAMNNLTGDLHAFSITDNNTALFSSYEKKKGEIKLHEAKSAHWYDGVVQEVDFENKQLVFQWRASDHFAFNDMATSNTWAWNDGWEEKPWDWFHLNSVVKDPWGNYLISARFNNAVTYVNGSNGEVIWNLGGKKNSFTDISTIKDAATNFSCQHDARWTDNYTAITLFDNSAFYGKTGPKARGVKIGLNFENMTAWHVASYVHPDNLQVESQGSHQVLPNGNSFIGYGFASAFSEYTAAGEMLCDWQFAPMFTEPGGKFSLDGFVQSYRAYKLPWKGYPAHDPEFAFVDGQDFYVTWNGATEVKKWSIAGGQLSKELKPLGPWKPLKTFEKTAFEASTSIEGGLMHEVYRLSAMDTNDGLLGEWTLTTDGNIQKYKTPAGADFHVQEPNMLFISVAAVSVLLVLVALKRPRILGGVYRTIQTNSKLPFSRVV